MSAPGAGPDVGAGGAPGDGGETQTEGILRGRFAGGVHPALHAINRSFDFDVRLWREDIDGSVAHARMLAATGILPAEAVERIVEGLGRVREEFEQGRFAASPDDEDVHMAVERRLTELIGEDGKRLHTGRSRNDQVATDLALYLVRASVRARAAVAGVQSSLVSLAERHGGLVLPFYTHLQRAQPVLLGHVLLAYVEMLETDRRLLHVEARHCPLGAGAGTGAGFPIDRGHTAAALGFAAPSPNSLATVSSRQEAAAFLAGLASCAVTLSRLGADLVLWCSREFGFARLGDAVSTGSSIMPQKRNPDGAELLRGKAARVVRSHGLLLELQRALPIGYAKDLQEDKPALFDAEDTLHEMLAVAAAMLGDVTFDGEAMRSAVDEPAGHMLATEMADWLVVRGVSFREAHHAVGAAVKAADARGVGLADLTADELAACHASLTPSVREALTPEAAVAARTAVGGTSPMQVQAQITAWRARLSD